MPLFDGMLKEGESLFVNHGIALDFDYMPKLIPYRENEQQYIASCLRPLFQNRNGRNVLVHGRPGIGKTAAIKHIFKELEEEHDELVTPVYINCWQKNTSYKILIEMCEQIGYKFTQNKKTEELFKKVKDILNKKSVVFAFDEIDKVEDFDFLYSVLEEIYRKSIILVSNYKEWIIDLDQRLKSRLSLELLHFRPYEENETQGILQQRIEFSFIPDVWDEQCLKLVVSKSFELRDIRTGLHLLRQSGNFAEDESKRKVELKHVQAAIEKLDELTIKQSTDLDEEARFVLNIVKLNSGKKIGDLFRLYQANGGKAVYKTFQRKIKKLKDSNFVSLKKIEGGAEGTTTIVTFQSVMKLNEFV